MYYTDKLTTSLEWTIKHVGIISQIITHTRLWSVVHGKIFNAFTVSVDIDSFHCTHNVVYLGVVQLLHRDKLIIS